LQTLYGLAEACPVEFFQLVPWLASQLATHLHFSLLTPFHGDSSFYSFCACDANAASQQRLSTEDLCQL